MERIIPATPSHRAIDKEQSEGKQRREVFYRLAETNWEGFFLTILLQKIQTAETQRTQRYRREKS
jgi:hypothetical protein